MGQSIQAAWYSIADGKLVIKNASAYREGKQSILSLLCRITLRTLVQKEDILFVVAYPAFQARQIAKSLALLTVLLILQKLGHVSLAVDFIDPPLFMTKTYVNRRALRSLLLAVRSFEEKQYLKHARLIIANSERMSDYIVDKYKVNASKVTSVPMGVRLSDFAPGPGRFDRKRLTVVYGGVISEERGIPDLIVCLQRINEKTPMDLRLCGRVEKPISIPDFPWLKVFSNLSYREYADMLSSEASVGIIPYPDNGWWGMVFISKLATYLAAGIPVLSTNLLVTAEYLTRWECGKIGASWEDIQRLLLQLDRDRHYCEILGNNARNAAKVSLDWDLLASGLCMKLAHFVEAAGNGHLE